MLKGEFVGDSSLKVIGALFAAICNLPSLFVVVAGNSGGGPFMAVARDFSAIVKVVEHAKLQCQLVLVGSDVVPIKSKRRIPVAYFQVAEHLVIRAILFDDVDHMANWIRATTELNASRIGVK